LTKKIKNLLNKFGKEEDFKQNSIGIKKKLRSKRTIKKRALELMNFLMILERKYKAISYVRKLKFKFNAYNSRIRKFRQIKKYYNSKIKINRLYFKRKKILKWKLKQFYKREYYYKKRLIRILKRQIVRKKSLKDDIFYKLLEKKSEITNKKLRLSKIKYGVRAYKLQTPNYFLVIRETTNNIFGVIYRKGKVFYATCGGIGDFRGARKSTALAAEIMGKRIGLKLHKKGIKTISIVLKSRGSFYVKSVILGLSSTLIKIKAMQSAIIRTHNGMKKRKIRRK
jgi:ribosomal protein S11